MSHWCKDIPRDEAVRAAEDGRQGPLPTLEEAIDGARAMMPKSVSATSAPKHENKGNGMRTERVTLEVTLDVRRHHPLPNWSDILRDAGALWPTESVRVVDEAIPPAPQSRPAETRQTQAKRIGGGWWFPKSDLPSPPPPPPPAPPRVHRGSGVFDANGDEVPWEGVVAALKDERDAAIRERDSLRVEKITQLLTADRFASAVAEADRLRARVAELESQLESVDCRAATAENRVAELERAAKLAPAANADAGSNHAAPAASVAANSSESPVSSEPVAWKFVATDGATVHVSTFEPVPGTATVVPLYASPPPVRGWLTVEERRTLSETAYVFDDRKAPAYGRFVRSLFARSSPPEVVRPKPQEAGIFSNEVRDAEWIAALAAAGVKVKEVGA